MKLIIKLWKRGLEIKNVGEKKKKKKKLRHNLRRALGLEVFLGSSSHEHYSICYLYVSLPLFPFMLVLKYFILIPLMVWNYKLADNHKSLINIAYLLYSNYKPPALKFDLYTSVVVAHYIAH